MVSVILLFLSLHLYIFTYYLFIFFSHCLALQSASWFHIRNAIHNPALFIDPSLVEKLHNNSRFYNRLMIIVVIACIVYSSGSSTSILHGFT